MGVFEAFCLWPVLKRLEVMRYGSLYARGVLEK